MIYGIVASKPIHRSVLSVEDAIIQSNDVGPVVTFGAVTFEQVVIPPAMIVELVFGGLAEGHRTTPGEGWYTLNPNMQVHVDFGRSPGAGEEVILEWSPQIGGDGENWVEITGAIEAVAGQPNHYLIGDNRYETNGISYHLPEARRVYYRALIINRSAETTLAQTPPEYFTYFADEAKTPDTPVRMYWDSFFAQQSFTNGQELNGFVDDRFWRENTQFGANRMVYDSTLQRIKPNPIGGVSANLVGIDGGADWNQLVVRARIYCPVATPGLGAGSGIVFTDNNDPQVEIFRWAWVGNKLRTITPMQTDEYTVPAGTTHLNVEMRMVKGSFGVTNAIMDDNGQTVWDGNGPSLSPAIDLGNITNISLFGTHGTNVDTWEYVVARETVNYFDVGQTN